MGKQANTKTRKRKLPALTTPEGRKSVQQTRELLDARFGRPFSRVELLPHLAWTVALPGFWEARESALTAIRTLEAELCFFRQLAATESEQQRLEIAAVEELRMGRPAGDVFADLSRRLAPEQRAQAERNVLRKAPQAARDAAELEIPRLFSAATETSPGAAFAATVVLGRTTSARQYLFPGLWIMAGLWLAEIPDIAALLETRRKSFPEWSALEPLEEGTLRGWKSTLRLVAYKGAGRLHFDQHCLPVADAALRKAFLQHWAERPEAHLLKSFSEFNSLNSRG